MNLTPQTIAVYQELITNPVKYGFEFTPITDFFEKSDIITAKHVLAESYILHVRERLPKLILYIIMDNIYGQCNGKDAKGNLGYYLAVYNQEEKK